MGRGANGSHGRAAGGADPPKDAYCRRVAPIHTGPGSSRRRPGVGFAKRSLMDTLLLLAGPSHRRTQCEIVGINFFSPLSESDRGGLLVDTFWTAPARQFRPDAPSPGRRRTSPACLGRCPRAWSPRKTRRARSGSVRASSPAEILLQLNARQRRARTKTIRPKPASRRGPITVKE